MATNGGSSSAESEVRPTTTGDPRGTTSAMAASSGAGCLAARAGVGLVSRSSLGQRSLDRGLGNCIGRLSNVGNVPKDGATEKRILRARGISPVGTASCRRRKTARHFRRASLSNRPLKRTMAVSSRSMVNEPGPRGFFKKTGGHRAAPAVLLSTSRDGPRRLTAER